MGEQTKTYNKIQPNWRESEEELRERGRAGGARRIQMVLEITYSKGKRRELANASSRIFTERYDRDNQNP